MRPRTRTKTTSDGAGGGGGGEQCSNCGKVVTCSETNGDDCCSDDDPAEAVDDAMPQPSSSFRMPAGAITGRQRCFSSMSSTMSSVSAVADRATLARDMLIVELPAEVLAKIMGNLPFKEVCRLRLVSRRFNEICASMLNSTFQRLQLQILQRFQDIKAKMPRRESARRNHALAPESDIVETLHMRLSLLQMTFGKHIERKHICFFAGEVLDEVQKIMRYVRTNSCLGRAYKVTDELFDLSTMAMEYFKERLEPTLPEITKFSTDFLEDLSSFPSPLKRRSQNGSALALASDAPACSSSRAASVVGSACSDLAAPAASLLSDEIQCGSSMVLRKRIKRIKQGMKKYNDQLLEVQRELKSCKNKMESQSKQVQEYVERLEQYDKKFEDSSKKFQTLLTELNKCKTELQFWRSRSSGLQGSSSSLLCPRCEGLERDSIISDASNSSDLKTLANQGVFPKSNPDPAELIFFGDEPFGAGSPQCSPRPVTRGVSTSSSSPPSPGASPATSGSGLRKRRHGAPLSSPAGAAHAANGEEKDASRKCSRSAVKGSASSKRIGAKRPKNN